MAERPELFAGILRTDTILEPLGDPAREARIMDKPLREWQERCFRELGITVKHIDSPEELPGRGIIVADDTFFTMQLLKHVVREGLKKGRSGQLALLPNTFTRNTTAMEGHPTVEQGDEVLVPYKLWWIDVPRKSLDNLPYLPIEQREKAVTPKGLDVFKPEGLNNQQSLTDQAILKVDHWLQLLYANLYALPSWWLEFRMNKVLWVIWRALSSLSLNKWNMFGRINKIGYGCDIHPTAVLEGCILGRGVKVGAFAYLQGTYIGDHVVVEPHARAMLSSIGAGSTLASHSQTNMSVLYPNALVTTPGSQLNVYGEGAMTLGHALMIDLKFRKEIKLLYKGKYVPIGTNNLGNCIGHRSILAARVTIGPGVVIPNDSFVVRDAEDIVTRVPEDLPKGGLFFAKNRTLVPIPQDQPKKKKQEQLP